MGDQGSTDIVLKNAERLLDDARLLFENGRFPTSASLAVLSIEEFGKAIHGMSVGHLSKQKAAASFGRVNHIIERLKETGLEIRRTTELSEEEIAKAQSADFVAIVADVLQEALPNSDWTRFADEIANKELLTIKNRGFYVNLDCEENVLSVPGSIDNTVAGRLIGVAASLLRTFEENWRLGWK
jgi:AbiV family abortive infection protein